MKIDSTGPLNYPPSAIRLFLIPSLDAVVVLTGDPDARSRGGNDAIYTLMDRMIVPYVAQSET